MLRFPDAGLAEREQLECSRKPSVTFITLASTSLGLRAQVLEATPFASIVIRITRVRYASVRDRVPTDVAGLTETLAKRMCRFSGARHGRVSPI